MLTDDPTLKKMLDPITLTTPEELRRAIINAQDELTMMQVMTLIATAVVFCVVGIWASWAFIVAGTCALNALGLFVGAIVREFAYRECQGDR